MSYLPLLPKRGASAGLEFPKGKRKWPQLPSGTARLLKGIDAAEGRVANASNSPTTGCCRSACLLYSSHTLNTTAELPI